MLTVNFGGKSRTVRVASITETEHTYSVFTTSGKVRPGRVAGGALQIWRRDSSVTFSATLAQQSRHVTSIEFMGASN